jgi:GT2 family glycosyltransferase
MQITILVPTLTRFDLLDRFIVSVNAQTHKADRLIIVDNSNGQCYPYDGTEIIKANNIGVAGSWNVGLKESDPNGLLVICNDDNVLKPNAIEELVKLVEDNPKYPFFASAGGGFSFFALRPKLAIENVGYFDEGFFPAYYEDNDYHTRMKLAGYDNFICTDQELYEMGVDGVASQTANGIQTPDVIKDYIHAGFKSNQYRYICKWGGLPGQEKYTVAFNRE